MKPSLYRRICLLGTYLTTLFGGRRVGRDTLGNTYYESRRATGPLRRTKRWVVYAGTPEASMVPPEWHGWLHHTFDAPLDATHQQSWQLPHQPNLTSTTAAYHPPGSQVEGGRRNKATGDYEAWQPN